MNVRFKTKRICIKDAVCGDYVKSFHIENNKVEYHRIKNITDPIVSEKDKVCLNYTNGKLITSVNHPVLYQTESGWQYKPAGELNRGDVCNITEMEAGASRCKIETLGKLLHSPPIRFKDLTVEETNNYYASSSPQATTPLILTHNSATFYYPIWHYEIEELLVLKNNKGVDNNRVRHVDYGVQFSKLFYQRLLENKNITLLHPNCIPGLYDAFYEDSAKFENLYIQAENDNTIKKRVISAKQLFEQFIEERKNTGRIYVMNVDNVNKQSLFKEDVAPVRMSNLCTEIDLPTIPMNDVNDLNGIVSLCTLGAINWGKIKSPSDFKNPCKILVRLLDEVLSYQSYLIPAANKANDLYRALGVGITNFAYFLAKNNKSYEKPDLDFIDEYAEAWSYYLIKASNELAKEKGSCDGIANTLYGEGVTPNETYKKELDEILPHKERMDWKLLRKDLKKYGIRNATTMALMPCESSSLVSNSTNGVEPPRGFINYKQSKNGVMAQVVPGFHKLRSKYELLWEQKSPLGYLYIMMVLQKYIDQGISVNQSHNPRHYTNEKIPIQMLVEELLICYKYGIKQLYYFNTFDGQGELDVDVEKNDPAECVSCVL